MQGERWPTSRVKTSRELTADRQKDFNVDGLRTVRSWARYSSSLMNDHGVHSTLEFFGLLKHMKRDFASCEYR
ncbi:hypothetical protein EYF80_028927 [Liparis tanakae]|uniref:Uncharacterized protein n=1 Tax=Liparis tanakae TaxID=230148 RepID=A0A4Z2H5Q1_9TELE|nr:hypothetical protein EYF80_028927 [Liparis tanakae]